MSVSRKTSGEFASPAVPALVDHGRSDYSAAAIPESIMVEPRTGLFSAVRLLPASALLLLIRIYQRTLSPALPILTMGSCSCRFSPTCSHYAADAIRRHGALRGAALAAIRLLKCTPLHPGGFDPVPERPIVVRFRRQPVCLRSPRSAG